MDKGFCLRSHTWSYPRWYWALAGVMASIGGIGLLIGLAILPVGAIAAWMVV